MTSPYLFYSAGDFQGKIISITLNFDNTTRAMINATVFRDPDCVFRKLLIGTGADGSPDSSTRVVNVPAGTTVVPASTLALINLNTPEDFLQFQITAQR